MKRKWKAARKPNGIASPAGSPRISQFPPRPRGRKTNRKGSTLRKDRGRKHTASIFLSSRSAIPPRTGAGQVRARLLPFPLLAAAALLNVQIADWSLVWCLTVELARSTGGHGYVEAPGSLGCGLPRPGLQKSLSFWYS